MKKPKRRPMSPAYPVPIPPSPPLVSAPLCTTSPPCGHCWYCKTAKWGPLWWLR